MTNEEKNAPMIKVLEEKRQEINELVAHFKEQYSNREASCTVTKLQEASHWVGDQIENLK